MEMYFSQYVLRGIKFQGSNRSEIIRAQQDFGIIVSFHMPKPKCYRMEVGFRLNTSIILTECPLNQKAIKCVSKIENVILNSILHKSL